MRLHVEDGFIDVARVKADHVSRLSGDDEIVLTSRVPLGALDVFVCTFVKASCNVTGWGSHV